MDDGSMYSRVFAYYKKFAFYANDSIQKMQEMCNLNGLKNLDDSVEALANLPCKNNIWSIVRIITIANTIIIDSVRSRLLTLKVKDTEVIRKVENVWQVQLQRKCGSSTSRPALPGNLKPETSKLPSRPPQTLKDPLINSSNRSQKNNLVPCSGTNGSDEIMSEAVNPESGIRGHIAGNLYGPSIRDVVNERPTLSNVLFVKGLPTDCTRREASHLFRPFPGFKDIKVVHKLAKIRGEKDMVLCFVEFANGRCALTALEALQGYRFDIKKPDSPSLDLQFAHFPFRLPSAGDTQYLAVPR
ncbi:Nucleotide-binding, alpha-beta plait [Artemisia annua]|uniref:Nucleotide-binding, alpha-beta plait n=1 Tax=Artemisia annua TaxID=35608 RepID=A0A2U1PGE3_ARTAN|nr:Nucleotide-binding, alpha-beta plait [Artemisia annua]